MNIITCSVRGLGRPLKKFLVKEFLDIYCAYVRYLQQSKLTEVSQSTWRSIGGSRLDQFRFMPSHRSFLGMIIEWNSTLLKGKVTFVGSYCLSVEFNNLIYNSSWVCTTVYGPNLRHLKLVLWEEIRKFHTSLPWVICGDFYSIFALKDNIGGVPYLVDIQCAQNLLRDLNLSQPLFSGRRFTWTNKQAKPSLVRLDCFLINLEWLMIYPRVHQAILPRLGSDHVPLRLESGVHYFKCKNFRFENSWYMDDNLRDLINTGWNESTLIGCGAFVLVKKIRLLKSKLCDWAKFSFNKLKKLASFTN